MEQQNLFADLELMEPLQKDHKEITVYETKILNQKNCNWQELFQGYTQLRAITFSSSLSFLSKIVPMFNQVELLFGNENVLGSLTDMVKYQAATTEAIKAKVMTEKNKKLLTMMDNKQLEVYLCQKKLSHKKIYLLANEEEGKYRAIFGSANLSRTAFEGIQGELILYVDDLESYKILLDNYILTKADAFQKLSLKAAGLTLEPKDTMEEIPLLELKPHQAYVEIHINKDLDTSQDERERKNYVDIEDQWDNLIKSSNIDLDALVKPDKKQHNIQLIKLPQRATLIENVLQKEKEAKQLGLPILRYNRKLGRMEYNQKEFPLDYDFAKAQEDAKILMEVFSTYNREKFESGDVEDARIKYMALFNYMAMAPFISVARQYAVKRHTGISGENFPLHLVLHGGSGAGKTWMIKFFQQLFFRSEALINNSEASPQKLMKYRIAAAGFPLVIDDCSKKRWDEYKANIKIDLLREENISPLLITTNDNLTFEPQFEKRVIIFKLSTISTVAKAIQKNPFIKRFDDISGDLYRMFLAKMMEAFPAYLNKLDHSDDYDVEELDFFKAASSVMYEVIKELLREDLPSYCKPRSLEWYLIQAVNDEKIRDIMHRYETTPEHFLVNKRENKLIMKTADEHDMNRLTKNFNQLLIIGKGTKADPYVVFDYKRAVKYFGHSFRKKKWWEVF